MRLVWRETLAAHQPYGLVWELVDEELAFNIPGDSTGGPVHAWLSPVYATILRPHKRRYLASTAPTGGPVNTFTSKTFRSLTEAKTWAQALVTLDPPTLPTE